jgi:D-alanyl-lipoteichoic acid acyltransferase DltB (MBOAT superfamily)
MLFNSIDFAIFLPIVFFLYWFVFKHNLLLQNCFIVVASYIFYGWWDWHFLILMTITVICSWMSGMWIARIRRRTSCESKIIERQTKAVMVANIVVNLLILGFYKYYNFFVQNFVEAFALFGKELEIHTLKRILVRDNTDTEAIKSIMP